MEPHIQKKLDTFFGKYTKQTFSPNHSLIAGNTPSGIFYLVSGHVKQLITDSEGNDIVVNIYKPETFFPMMWAVTDIPNRYYFHALDDVTVYRAPKQEVIDFIRSEPEILLDLLNRVYAGLDAMLYRLEYSLQGNAYNKAVAALILLVRRFGSNHSNTSSVALTLPLSHQTLASLSGISQETFTRTLSKLKTKGIVSYDKHTLTITNPSLLYQEIESD